MKVYFDTNVLIAALHPNHPHHPDSFAALARTAGNETEGYFSAQGLSELYSVLTRTPFNPPIYPDEARPMIEKTVVRLLHIVNLRSEDYLHAVAICTEQGLRGGRIHDAVHVQAAVRAGCDVIYTYDQADFASVRGQFQGRIDGPPAS